MAASETDDEAEKVVEPGSDEAILAELNERYDYAILQKQPIIDRADTCVAYSGGDTWNSDDRSARAGRPMLKLDQLSQYTNQLVNSFRQNPRGAKVSPDGRGATDKTATLRADRIRQIEYESHAQEVYTVGGENAVSRGYGYARIVAEYEDSESDNQVLRLKAIPNPNQVVEDPDGQSTSGADWDYLFFIHTITRREFTRDYPDAQIKDFTPELMTLHPKWFGKDGRVQIAEYWYVTETPPKGGKGKPTRTVCMYLTNGVELLAKKGYPKKTEWPGDSIPFAACYGKITYATDPVTGDSQKWCDAYIWLALDAAKGYNWTKSTELEALALPVKAALFAYQGQLDQTNVDLVTLSTRTPVALIQAKATTEETGQTVLPLPQYGTRAPDIQGYEIAAESFRRDVQNALGHYSSNDARQGASKVISGAALDSLKKSGDLGSYHYAAHYDDFVRELASKINQLLRFYDDTAKDISTRDATGKTKSVTINTPTSRDKLGNPAYGPDDLRMDQGAHTVTIATGPSSDSQRAEGKEAAMTLLGNPEAFPVVASTAVKLMDLGVVGDELAEDLEFLQPAAMQQARAAKQGKGNQPNPQQLQQENAQLKQQLQDAHGVMQQQEQDLKGKQAEIASKEKIAQMTLQQKSDEAEKDRAARIEVARISAAKQAADLHAETLEEQLATGVQIEEAAKQRTHELNLHTQKLAHASDLAAQARQATQEAAQTAARSNRSVQFTKGPDGAVQSATITGDPGPPPGAGAGA